MYEENQDVSEFLIRSLAPKVAKKGKDKCMKSHFKTKTTFRAGDESPTTSFADTQVDFKPTQTAKLNGISTILKIVEEDKLHLRYKNM